jgi:phage FluMu gp28-like protein
VFGVDKKQDNKISLAEAGWQVRPYQKSFIYDESRFVAVLKSRQIGFSEALVQRGCIESITRNNRDIIFVSTNYTNAKELIRKAKRWFQVMALLDPDLDVKVAKDSAGRIELTNGSRLIAVPCKAAAIRGYAGTVYLDEVAFYENDMEIFKAVRPILDSKPSMSLVLVSTPFGEQGLFWKAVTGQLSSEWSIHKYNVYDAVRDGYNPAVLKVKNEVPEEVWLQEYLCAFVVDGDRYFDHRTLKKSFTDKDDWAVSNGAQGVFKVLGVDVARSRDKTVLAELWVLGDEVFVMDVEVLKRQGETMDHTEQFERIKRRLYERPVDALAIDARGEGSGLADFLGREFGSHRVGRIMPSAQFYDQWIPELRLRMSAGKFNMENDTYVVGAFRQIKREISANNNALYRIADSVIDDKGHADEFMAILNAFSLSGAGRMVGSSRKGYSSIGKVKSRFDGVFGRGIDGYSIGREDFETGSGQQWIEVPRIGAIHYQ